jgi:hypothetical protein
VIADSLLRLVACQVSLNEPFWMIRWVGRGSGKIPSMSAWRPSWVRWVSVLKKNQSLSWMIGPAMVGLMT